jgi:hypothetical protein
MKLSNHPRPALEFLLEQTSVTPAEGKALDEEYQRLASLLPFPQQKDDETLLKKLPSFCRFAKPKKMLERLLEYLCQHFSIGRGYLQTEFLEEYQGDAHDVGYFEADSAHGGHLVVKKVDKADGYLYAAILIHEFMRFLLHHSEVDLSSPDVEEEEILTDLAAVFTGFGPVMMLGYCPVEDKEHTHLFGYDASSLGYLNVDQLAYIERRYVLVLDARIR